MKSREPRLHLSTSRPAGPFRLAWALIPLLTGYAGWAQPYGQADRGEPGDAMIQAYLRLATETIEAESLGTLKTAEDWTRARPRLREEYLDMLGLWPLPDRTPLHATITRTLDRGDHVVDLLHYQSRPGLYVTGNLYRPARIAVGERLPAILYVCGHSPRGRNGNKTAYQSHGIWFARHGYVCLVLDTLEMGEITCTHHGTYRDERWWWLSRGYTPAGVECWNGIRGLDYLVSRADVDPERMGVTGISGGGAATFWIAAADERVQAAVPVSGLSDLSAYVTNRVINGHCDCMFLYNTYQWPWARIAGMVAPRPLLFANSDQDPIFPMDGNERVINRLERLYALFGAGDLVDSVVSLGGHAYRQDLRQSAYRFLNTHLKHVARPVTDSEVDLVTSAPNEVHPIPPEQLRVFPLDSDVPRDAVNSRIDHEFVPRAAAEPPDEGRFPAWRDERLARLRQLTFHHFPGRIPPAVAVETNSSGTIRLNTEPGITIRARPVQLPASRPRRVWLVATGSSLEEGIPAWLKEQVEARDAVYVCEPRGIGGGRWTTRNPPNYVERSLYLLGRTADSGRVWDLAAAAAHLRARHGEGCPVYLAGERAAAALAVYAALWEPEVAGLVLSQVPVSHMDRDTPVLLNVLRVCDVPQAIGLLAPRPITLVDTEATCRQAAAVIYGRAGAPDRLTEQPSSERRGAPPP